MGKEYLLQGLDFSLRLKKEEEVAEVLVVRFRPDPLQDPSLTKGKPPFP